MTVVTPKLCKSGQQLGNTILHFQGFGHDETKNWPIQGYLLKGFYSAQLPDHTGIGHAPAFPLSFSRKQDVSQVSIFKPPILPVASNIH